MMQFEPNTAIGDIKLGASKADVEKILGSPDAEGIISELSWIPSEMRDDYKGMVITEHTKVNGAYTVQLTYLSDSLKSIKVLPEAGPVMLDAHDLFGTRHLVLAELFKDYGLPLDDGTQLYWPKLGLVMNIQEDDYTVVILTSGKMEAPLLEEGDFEPLLEDDAVYLTEDPDR